MSQVVEVRAHMTAQLAILALSFAPSVAFNAFSPGCRQAHSGDWIADMREILMEEAPEFIQRQDIPGNGRRTLLSGLIAACVGLARPLMAQRRTLPKIDSHLHLWSPDRERFPWTIAPPATLNTDGRATFENFVQLMDRAGTSHAVVVQPINYGQDYKYLMTAMDAYPTRLKGMFLADPSVPAVEARSWVDQRAASHANWIGIRFNPYKWPESSKKGMADDVGKAMFQRAGELGLIVGFMTFKGLSRHASEIEELLQNAPQTQVVIDHWGFFLQPATGFGDNRTLDEESWQSLLRLSSFPQVSVKISACFRVAQDGFPFVSLSNRLEELLSAYGSRRLLWGSDFPYVTEHNEYDQCTQAFEQWPVWQNLSGTDRENLLFKTSERLFRF